MESSFFCSLIHNTLKNTNFISIFPSLSLGWTQQSCRSFPGDSGTALVEEGRPRWAQGDESREEGPGELSQRRFPKNLPFMSLYSLIPPFKKRVTFFSLPVWQAPLPPPTYQTSSQSYLLSHGIKLVSNKNFEISSFFGFLLLPHSHNSYKVGDFER